ncbi:Carboxypeptidase regulatory-like domain-containing protein [Catalinimonas alkaloidigena]|uniref:Carboxypeptidase regulatory-like domain-containing protein n=1 Tax=Catalinimonas alkaloidigena TaxID=1075417 RepID=A0A1G9VUQ1_9BACT|nr:carboxypeptidase-like regulatory domain-containing protein [Catalinimonas alkaloidigena]SDM75647.1 Carboxypeptidase regulatory-like domain-containing protein [Catalinimonas alkaloidigena]
MYLLSKISSTSLLFAALCLAACQQNDDPTPDPTPQPEPYTVSGTVVDTQGNPMAGIKVRADDEALYGSLSVTTDANGHYQMPRMTLGGWKIYAWKEVRFNGKTYHLRLGMPHEQDYDAFSPGQAGEVRDFVWKLSGIIPDRTRSDDSPAGYFGGTIFFSNFTSDWEPLPAGAQVTVTFTPETGATLFDGSAPQPLQKSFTIEREETFYYLHDIPQSIYRISATCTHNGVTKNLQLTDTFDENWGPALEHFYFRSADGISYENGMQSRSMPYFMKLE